MVSGLDWYEDIGCGMMVRICNVEQLSFDNGVNRYLCERCCIKHRKRNHVL